MMFLQKLNNLSKHISIGITGMGAMGKGLLYQTTITPGMRCVAISDRETTKAVECAEYFNLQYNIVSTSAELEACLSKNILAICDTSELLTNHCQMDAFIESTSAISDGARYVSAVLSRGIHAVLMNAEIDLVFGEYFKKLAEKNKVVCTSCDGDQHGVLKRLASDIKLWGFDLVMSGNIKGYLDRNANPTSIIPEADKRKLDYRMATAYTDGTKLNIEMALIANNLDLTFITPGMLGHRVNRVAEVFDAFNFTEIYEKHPEGVVDFIIGAEPHGGVFTVGYCDNTYQQELLSYYKLGKGPFYLFYRPYHLCHVEAMECVAAAVLDNYCLLDQPTMRINVGTYAKKDLSAGEILDGLGGYASYGKLQDTNSSVLPICLSKGARLVKNISKNAEITLDDVSLVNASDFNYYKDLTG